MAAKSRSCSKSRVILLSRHGESENNLKGKIGGDACLSRRGKAYAQALSRYINSLDFDLSTFHVWTSCYQRTIRTAAGVHSGSKNKLPELDELNAGLCEGLSYEEIQELYPEEFAMRDQDKLRYRYPKGESYEDVLQRLKPLVDKLQTADENYLIVSHQAIIRCILTHFLKKPWGETPYIQVPLHTIIWLSKSRDDEEWEVHVVQMPIECVDTFRPKPINCCPERTTQDALTTVPTHY
jgi:6-phosphofructo-2-kinase/fructose-2,6-biphosphatase